MFTIIGGDGKEYGPVTLEQVRGWITAGRANLDTKAKALGTEEWRRLGDYAEFGPPANLPPPMPPLGAYATAPAAPEPAVPATAPLAGRGERLLAQLLDNVVGIACALPGVIMIALAAARAGLGLNGNWANLATAAGFSAGLVVFGFAMLVLFGVQLWMLVTRGQTIGKRALGVRIVRFEGSSFFSVLRRKLGWGGLAERDETTANAD